MADCESARTARSAMVRGYNRDGSPSDHMAPAPPSTRVVTKGWWVVREEEAALEELEQADRKQR